MADIRSSVACNVDANLLRACLPLFEAEKVGAIEWAFDTLYGYAQMPDWFDELLRAYSDEGCLIGHGVFFSLFSGRWSPEQQAWLDQLTVLTSVYQFDHITEHFGFMTGSDFHKGAPLSLPLTPSTLAIGQDRLLRIQQAAGCPVGLENLAFAYSIEDVKRQGDFLQQLLEPVNGFLILDLHNLYCQGQNFDLTRDELLGLFPLDRVREMHVSGGSWSLSLSNPDRKIRRDTHDDAVPADVFTWLDAAIDACPNLKYVVMEQLGSGLVTDDDRGQFGRDFLAMDQIVQAKNQVLLQNQPNPFRPAGRSVPGLVPVQDAHLHRQQRELAIILETADDYRQAQELLAGSGLAQSAWQVEQWDPAMLETALAIAQKWRDGFN